MRSEGAGIQDGRGQYGARNLDGVSEHVEGWMKPSCREGVLDISCVRFAAAGLRPRF